ncbi:MAG: 4-hydroxybutyrate--acetyl-CoA CoA transferase [Defluviitaleaceae bacterium]|nr:4-hydroxybutyrate--acetyl-CoA CoA transferase [Defluviitaleaceae bacterium]
MRTTKATYVSVEEALASIKSDDVIVSAMAAAEPREIVKNLHTIAHRVKNVTVTTCLPFEPAMYFNDPSYQHAFNMDGWFYTATMRKAQRHGAISFIPNHLHLAGAKRIAHQKPTVFIGTASLPDEHGYVSLSLSNVYEKQMIEAADLVILEVNPNFPRTFGDVELHLTEVDHLIKTDYEVPELPNAKPSEKDLKIGAWIAEKINDGDCLQLGIGGIPNAVAYSLMDKKDLGIHTEMFTTGLMALVKAGVVTGKKKQLHKGKHVAAFAMGTKELYDFIHNNPSVLILDGQWTNDPYTIGQNDNQVSINTTIEIDLTGQCASETIGHLQYSGTGGQADTAIGAQRAKNGRSFIALYSTAMVTNKETGEREEISKIVPFLKPGAAVSLSRNDVDHVVTEYGIAQLRGTSVRERVERLIAIAHPKFRDELLEEAKKLGYVF